MTTNQTNELTWDCVACGKPIENTDGHLHIDVPGDVLTREAEWHEFRKERTDEQGFFSMNMADFGLMPEKVRWQAHHDACDRTREANDYSIPVEDIRTPRKLLGMTAHLMEKTWLEHTNWQDVIRDKAGPDA
ncbi:hypothetical protein ACXR8F_04000 [Terrabacter sp. AAH1]